MAWLPRQRAAGRRYPGTPQIPSGRVRCDESFLHHSVHPVRRARARCLQGARAWDRERRGRVAEECRGP